MSKRRVRGLEATKLFWQVAPTTYWCPRCGVPLLRGSRCPRCNAIPMKVYATQPRDLRPAYERDVAIIREALERSYGARVARRLMPYDGLYLLNKIQYFDAADEVISGGYVIGVRYYDPFDGRWHFRITRFGASLILLENLPGYGRVRVRLREGRVLERGDFYELVEPDGDAEWIAVEDFEGRQGIAKRIGEGRYRVGNVWWKLHILEKIRGASLHDAVVVNKQFLEEMEQEALEFIKRELSSRSGRPVAMFSGGKDSTIAVYLAAQAGVREAVFVDTGLEHPETIDTVERVVEKIGVNLHRFEAGDLFWRLVEKMGPPGRDYRWCTRLLKLAVLSRGYRRLGYTRIISITGQRAVESTSRAQAGRVAPTGPPNPEGVMLSPIYNWSSLAEHLYIAFRRLPLHPLYCEGFERIGCYMCPIGRIPEYEYVKSRHPDLWQRWERVLARYASTHRLPKIWIKLALWRWRYRYPGDLELQLARRGYKARELLVKALGMPVTLDTTVEPPEALVLEVDSVDPEHIAGLGRTLGYNVEKVDGNSVVLWKEEEKGKLRFEVDRRPAVKVYEGGKPALFDALSLVYMAGRCLGEKCGLCEAICGKNAIRVENGRPRVDPGKCDSCKQCVMICPAVMKALSALRLIEYVGQSIGEGSA
ncbi:MAG TPA: hypothetical protein EYH08_01340 [Pyrodictium sp.]|nr:hypothetical protein [Pyrodictium sp.]